MTTTHRFYTEAMGFELVKAVMAPTPQGGWAKHVFYDTGGNGLLAFWDLHIDRIDVVRGAISTDLGLPDWVNHLAFDAPSAECLDDARGRWLDLGFDVVEIDHGFCHSMYTVDPNGILVEWCHDTRALTDDERDRAAAVIDMAEPDRFDDPPQVTFHTADPTRRPDWATPVAV